MNDSFQSEHCPTLLDSAADTVPVPVWSQLPATKMSRHNWNACFIATFGLSLGLSKGAL
jgi:hypothetical protein